MKNKIDEERLRNEYGLSESVFNAYSISEDYLVLSNKNSNKINKSDSIKLDIERTKVNKKKMPKSKILETPSNIKNGDNACICF